MPVESHLPLPPLRRTIRRRFFALIGLFALLGIFMVASIFFAGGMTPKLIQVNYESIASAMQMRRTWDALQNPLLYPEKPVAEWAAQFEKAITFAESNITEPGEDEIVRNIRRLWNQVKVSPTRIDAHAFIEMNDHIDTLIYVNEEGMYNLAEDSTSLGRKVFLVSILFFLATLGLAVLLADGLANRLARPIKDIADVLKADPGLDRRLTLPKPASLEMRNLNKEILDLWERLARFHEMNAEELAAERERLETVFATVEDPVLVLDNERRVLQVSDGMLKVLKLQAKQVIGHRWLDLSTSEENYLRLRERLVADPSHDGVVDLMVDGAQRTYAARSREIVTKTDRRIGLLCLLHDLRKVRKARRISI